jgi:recombination protein RecA
MAKAKGKEAKNKEESNACLGDASQEERQVAFDSFLDQLNNEFGKGAVQKISSESSEGAVEDGALSTGIIQVDRATMIGGLPKGRIIEIYGPEMSGKTTLCLYTTAEVMKKGDTQIYVDMEHALEKKHVIGCGADGMNIIQPTTGEEALGVVERACMAGVSLVVVDSVAALVPKDEADGEMGKSHIGLQARLMSQALRKLVSKAARGGTTIIFINQIRHKVGVMFGSPEVTSGGQALKFYASTRIDMRRKDPITMNGRVVGHDVRALIKKNKVGVPLEEGLFKMYFEPGFTVAANIIDFASQVGIVDKAGTWYSYGEEKLGQGITNATRHLINQKPHLVEEILEKCRANLYKPIVDIADIL